MYVANCLVLDITVGDHGFEDGGSECKCFSVVKKNADLCLLHSFLLFTFPKCI